MVCLFKYNIMITNIPKRIVPRLKTNHNFSTIFGLKGKCIIYKRVAKCENNCVRVLVESYCKCDICCIVYTWRQIVLSDDFLVTLEHDVTRVVMTSHEY